MEWVRNNKDAGSFMLVMDLFDPHEPWYPPMKYARRFYPDYKGANLIWPGYGSADRFTGKELKWINALYRGEIAFYDLYFGYFMEELKRLDLYDNSLIMFVSDHGHCLGEHNYVGKSPPYLTPQEGGGTVNDDYVGSHDFAPTFLSAANIQNGPAMDGTNILDIVSGRIETKRSYVTSASNNHYYFENASHRFICHNTGKTRYLYDKRIDPDCTENIAEQEKELTEHYYSMILKDAGGFVPDYTDVVEALNDDGWRSNIFR